MLIGFYKRISRWLHQEGVRGFYRKVKRILRYWHFRAWVFYLRKRKTSEKPDAQFFSFVKSPPLFSILLPAYRTHSSWLLQAVNSVREQGYRDWELCIGLCEVNERARSKIEDLARLDVRIRVFILEKNLGISGNSNLLAREAKGEFLAVLDHDDYLESHALQEVASFVHGGELDLIYTDEDVVSPRINLPSPPNIKPDWAPDSFHSCNYICHFCCFRRSLFEMIGGFRSEYDSAQDYDLFLRLIEKTNRIAHIPKVLYHWRRHTLSTASGKDGSAKPSAWETARQAMESHIDRGQQKAKVEMGNAFGTLHVRYIRETDPLVDIIIPSTNHENTLERCLNSILRLSRYTHFQITVMLNGPGDFTELMSLYAEETRIKMRHFEGPFNYSRINNIAAGKSKGEILLFLNDDIEITDPEWLEGLLEYALRDGVGAVGPMLLYSNGRIQHSGITVDSDQVTWEYHKKLPQTTGDYQSRAQIIQNVSAVTGACLCTRKKYFEEVGGFDEELSLAYNDIDYCLKLREKKYRVIYTPFVRLIHHESFTRGSDAYGEKRNRLQRETNRMREKWGRKGLQERYFDAAMFKPKANLKHLASCYLGYESA